MLKLEPYVECSARLPDLHYSLAAIGMCCFFLDLHGILHGSRSSMLGEVHLREFSMSSRDLLATVLSER